MNQQVKDTAKLALNEIARARKYSENPTPHELFISSETLVSCLASLLGPLMDAETQYRQKVKLYISDSDMSNAKAEVFAKADEEYKSWQKLKLVYELAEQQIMIVKKFSSLLGDEYKRS